MNFADFTNRVFGFAVMALVLVISSCWAACPTRENSLSLDLDKFAGNWYLIAATPTSGKSVSKCAHLAVKKKSADTFGMIFSAISRRNNRRVKFNMNGQNDDDINGTWQLQGSNRTLGPFKHRIIAADNDSGSYLTMIVCAENKKDIFLREFSMILSRNNSLSPTVLDDLTTKLTTYFPREEILNVAHTDCQEIY